ncbi:MAG: YgiQ family radical SAM protein [Bradymonadales bacterium]|nr:YgiQ family radical SAM protein [Bradymonadales bacterium]
MISRTGSNFDIILVTAEPYEDHPASPVGIIARVLDAEGYTVGIAERPDGIEDLAALGVPRLFYGVTSGSIDSMLYNYTALKRPRSRDEHARVAEMPDRALIVYSNWIKRISKDTPIVLGGIEASLRRFAHYDYWDNRVRRSILFDARAELLVYGNGEKQIIEIARRLSDNQGLMGIEGTCVVAREPAVGFELLPSCRSVAEDRLAFCRMTAVISNDRDLAQEYDNNYLLQFRYPVYTSADLDRIYSLPFRRDLRPGSPLELARFSVVTHRGCVGRCHFCSLALHQGTRIISRSEESILAEIERLSRDPHFKGYIDDLGGPSANMYGMDCAIDCGQQEGACLSCGRLDRSHDRLIRLMRRARSIPGVKKVFVRSGIRYDLAVDSPRYVEELSAHHLSGTLKIAPEHLSPRVLELMNKDNSRLDEFIRLFERLNRNTRQALRYYLMIGHPGDDRQQVRALGHRAVELGNIEQFQLFTPTPMSISSCMYWTGLNPFTLEPVTVVRDYRGKKELKRIMLEGIARSHRRQRAGSKDQASAKKRHRDGHRQR